MKLLNEQNMQAVKQIKNMLGHDGQRFEFETIRKQYHSYINAAVERLEAAIQEEVLDLDKVREGLSRITFNAYGFLSAPKSTEILPRDYEEVSCKVDNSLPVVVSMTGMLRMESDSILSRIIAGDKRGTEFHVTSLISLAHRVSTMLGFNLQEDLDAYLVSTFTKFDTNVEDSIETLGYYRKLGLEVKLKEFRIGIPFYAAICVSVDRPDSPYHCGQWLRSRAYRAPVWK